MSDWSELEDTRVAQLDSLREELERRTRDRACLIVLAGQEVGKMFRLDDGETVVGRSQRADIQLDDDSISRMHIKLKLDGTRAEVEDLNSSNGTHVNGDRISTAMLSDGDKLQVGETTILKFTFHDRLDESFQQKMYDAALRDPLTRTFNKKYFLDQLATEVAYARRHKTQLSLVLFDLDHFKNVNDSYGHPVGDRVLVDIAKLVTGMLRAEDVFARYGGEEFAIILRGIDVRDAAVLSERLRVAIEQCELHAPRQTPPGADDERIPVTVSVGVAAYQAAEPEPEKLVQAADTALYAAKNGGRNRVIVKYE